MQCVSTLVFVVLRSIMCKLRINSNSVRATLFTAAHAQRLLTAADNYRKGIKEIG